MPRASLRSLESEMILRLRDRVRDLGYTGPELAEWIPIYGRHLGVFSVKRELKPVELGRLKQSVFTLENELHSNPEKGLLYRPRLLNRYFWLIDHYQIRGETGPVEEIWLKIKIVDPAVYERFRN